MIRRLAPYGVALALGFALGYQVHASGAARDAADFSRRLNAQRDRRDVLARGEGVTQDSSTASRTEG